MDSTLIHHGVMFSYYSAKTRAYLSYKRIPFSERHISKDMQRIRDTTHKMMIPVVEMPDGEILQDTTVIIDELESRYAQRPVVPNDPVMLLVTRLVEFIVDELWISTSMNSRWNDPESNAWVQREFGIRFGQSMGLPTEQQSKIGENVAGRMQSYLPQLGVGDAAGQKVANAFFEEATRRLDQAVGPLRFAFGERPSLIDFCLFTAYYAHQYRDLGAAQRFMKANAPHLCYYLDNLHVGAHLPDVGELSISEPLRHYIDYIASGSVGFARGLAEAGRELATSATPGEPFEKRIDPFTFDLDSAPFTRGGSTFSLWKLQRVRDVYQTLGAQEREAASNLVGDSGWTELLEDVPGFRLARVNHQICLE